MKERDDDIISAYDFYRGEGKSISPAKYEILLLKAQIVRADVGRRKGKSPVMDSESDILSPFPPNYELKPEAKEELRKYGWELDVDRICPIDKTLKSSENRKRFL